MAVATERLEQPDGAAVSAVVGFSKVIRDNGLIWWRPRTRILARALMERNSRLYAGQGAKSRAAYLDHCVSGSPRRVNYAVSRG